MKISVAFGKIDKGRIQARVNNSGFNFSIHCIIVQIIVKMIYMNESNKYLQEFDHKSIFQYFDHFSC